MRWLKTLLKAAAAEARENLNPGGPGISNLTPKAEQVLAFARKEADRLKHGFVGTEHILLGMLALGQGTAVEVLTSVGIDVETVRDKIETFVGVGTERARGGRVPYTPRVKRALALAAKEAQTLKNAYVGTEHLLLGLMGEGDGVAARVLRQLGVDLQMLRREVFRRIDPNASQEN
jgi:ATP-dependent Clp protease ATP-binding subunit ClpC